MSNSSWAQPVRDSSRCQGRRYPRQLLLFLLLRRSTAPRPVIVSYLSNILKLTYPSTTHLMVERDDGVGNGGDHRESNSTGCRRQVQWGQAGAWGVRLIHQVSKYGFAPVCTQDSDSHRDCKDSEAKLVRPLEAQQLGYVFLIIKCCHMNQLEFSTWMKRA